MKALLPAAASVVLVAGSLVSTGCVVVDSQGQIARDEKHFAIDGPPELHLTTYDGAIEIHSGDAKTVTVEIEKRGPSKDVVDQLVVDTRQNGNRIDVEVKKPDHEYIFLGIGHLTPSAKLIVTMPTEGNVIAKSGDGSIRLEHVKGHLDLHTGDGSIRGTNVGGDMSLSSGDGSITLDGADGDLEVETGDGSISVAGALGALKVHTGDGSVTVHASTDSAMKKDWSITTGDGGVSVYLPSGFNADIDAHTGDGSIRNELGIASTDGASSKRNLRGRLGSGGKTLAIRTGDGSIHLNQQ